ncbi:MAG: translocation/assembly module TamB [Bacteroidota bacterium]|nr:translocation/assembly module TamB [Bacteroidota bacterium]
MNFVQQWSKDRFLSWLDGRIEQSFQLEEIHIDLIRGVQLKNVLILDHHQDTILYASKLNAGLRHSFFSLLKNELDISKIEINQGVLKLISYEGEEFTNVDQFIFQFNSKAKDKNKKKFNFNIEDFNLSDIEFYHIVELTGKTEKVTIHHAAIKAKNLNFAGNYYSIKKVMMDGVKIDVRIQTPEVSLPKVTKGIVYEIPKDSCKIPMIIYVESLSIANSQGHFQNFDFPPIQDPFFDPNHFVITHFETEIEQMQIENMDFKGKVQHLAAQTDEGFTIKEFKAGNIDINTKKVSLEQFVLETNNSQLRDSFYLMYTAYSDFKDFSNKVFVNFLSDNSKLAVKDVIYFARNLNKNAFFQKNKDQIIEIDGQIIGKSNSLKSNKLLLRMGDQFLFEGNVSTRDMNIRGKELLSIRVKQLKTSMKTLKELIPGFSVPDSYLKLGKIQFKGDFDGFFEDFVSYGSFQTDLGAIQSDMRLNLRPGKAKANFSGSIQLKNFDLGTLIKIKDLEKVNAKAIVENGVGLTFETMNARLSLVSDGFVYKKYGYKNLIFKGVFSKQLLDGTLKIEDENISLNFEGKIADINKIPSLSFDLSIQKANLKALNLISKPYTIQAVVKASLRGNNIDNAIGNLNISDLIFNDGVTQRTLKIEKLSASQQFNEKQKNFKLNFDFGVIELNGIFNLEEIPNQISNLLWSNVPELANLISLPKKPNANNGRFSYNARLINLEKLTSFFTIPVNIADLNLEGSLDQNKQSGEIQLSTTFIHYQDFVLRNVMYKSTILNGQWNSNMTSDYVFFNKSKVLNNVELIQLVSSNKLSLDFITRDSLKDTIIHRVKPQLLFDKNSYQLVFAENSLYLNKKYWNLNAKHQIGYQNKKVNISNFDMSDSSHFISVRDIDGTGFGIKADGFDISAVNPFINNKGLRFSGIFNLDLTIPDIKALKNLQGNLQVFQLHLNKNNYGPFNIDFSLENPENPFKIKITNQYKEHTLTAEGVVNIPLKKNYALPKYEFDFSLNLKNFPASFLQDFILSISETRGGLSGSTRLSFRNKKISIDGSLMTDQVESKINYLGTKYIVDKQEILFSKDKFIFNDIILKDKLNNSIRLNGDLRHENLNNYFLNLDIRSPEALILDTKKGNSLPYYGYAICDFSAQFSGPLSRSDIYIKARSLKGSNLAIPVRREQEAKDNSFIKFTNKVNADSIRIAPPITIKGLNFLMDLSVTDDAQVSIIFNEVAGDIIRAVGRGDIQISSLRDGTFSLKGEYEVEEGQYLFTLLNFVNKPFKIKRGGQIRWNGNPFNADISIDARYEGLYTNIYPFIQEYLDPSEVSLVEEAKKRTEIELTMLLRGSLLSPTVNFVLAFPGLTGTLKTYADNKLRLLEDNPDQLNQQVFGLLVFSSFLNSNNPFEGGLISNLGTSTINTISELLSNQFSLFVSNLLSEAFENVDFISGVDFNVAYDVVDNPLIADTKLNQGEFIFSLRHRLWNDQWAVTLGGNYQAVNTFTGNSYFTPESVIEWNTPVPGLKLRIYYKSNEAIEGQKHKIGSGISFRKEFDSFLDFKKELKSQSKSTRAAN